MFWLSIALAYCAVCWGIGFLTIRVSVAPGESPSPEQLFLPRFEMVTRGSTTPSLPASPLQENRNIAA